MAIELIERGKPFGSVASVLLKNGFNVNALRTNDTLLYDEWKLIDTAVMKAYQDRLVVAADLQARGLTYDIGNGLAKTVLAYQDMSDVNDAEMSMDGIRRGDRDRPDYQMNYLPLPIIHKDFSFSARELAESRNGSMPLDTTMAERCARKIAEKVEDIILTGASTYSFGGGAVYGFLDFPDAQSVSLSAHWNDSGATGATILDDVLSMKQKMIDAKRYGPWMVYACTDFETKLDEDYVSGYPKTIRQRLLEIGGIIDVKIADHLTADYVVMVQMTSDVIRLVNGLGITTVQWDTEGGMQTNFKVMTIQVPQIRTDQPGKTANTSGVVYAT